MRAETSHGEIGRTLRATPAWAPAAVIAAFGLAFALAAEAGPRDSQVAAGVYPPWWSQAQVLSAAARAGDIAAVGAVPFVVVVRSPRGPAADSLAVSGALFSLDAGLARLCGS